jgi:6-phosphogluconolactonase
MIFRFDKRSGKLLPSEQASVQLKPGAGPRHLAFHPNGKVVFSLNELDSTITAFARDQRKGTLKELQTLSSLPTGFTGNNSGADIHLSPDGRFLYSSNRGHDSIAIFVIDSQGALIAVDHESTGGSTPRNFALDPTGGFLLAANQKSDNIVVFKRDQKTGRLSPTGHVAQVPSPVCLKFTAPFS